MSIRDIKIPKYRYNPITKKIERTERKKREKRKTKHRRNLIGCYPGYKFTINGVEYICTDGTDLPRPLNPIPVRIYPTPDGPERIVIPTVPREKYF